MHLAEIEFGSFSKRQKGSYRAITSALAGLHVFIQGLVKTLEISELMFRCYTMRNVEARLPRYNSPPPPPPERKFEFASRFQTHGKYDAAFSTRYWCLSLTRSP